MVIGNGPPTLQLFSIKEGRKRDLRLLDAEASPIHIVPMLKLKRSDKVGTNEPTTFSSGRQLFFV